PGYPQPQNLTQSWWCGYGPYDAPSIVVCAVIENGGHGGTAAAPAARKVVESVGVVGVLRRLDWLLLGALVALVAYGLWAIDGITMHDTGGSALNHQALYAFVGGLLFVAVLFVDPERYRVLRRPIFFGMLGLMGFLLVAGAATRGSRRWIDVGFFTFQPSEFGKVVLVLAGFAAERARSIQTISAPVKILGYGLIPILLVFLQPDIGTALVYTAAL